MENPWTKTKVPSFHYMLRASGQCEVWHDAFKDAKLRQYGWRCSTSEDAYTTATLIGNWSERRFDARYSTKLRRPLPSQVSPDSCHNFHDFKWDIRHQILEILSGFLYLQCGLSFILY